MNIPRSTEDQYSSFTSASGVTMAENIFMTPHAPLNQLGLKFSDIVDSIPSDKDYGENDMSDYVRGGTPSEANCSAVSSLLSRNDPDIEQKKKAYVQIIEQPQPKALRFRYICEGRSAGSIPGVRSTAENKTFPKIKIVNYKGPAVVVVSCVTVDPPYRPHPHNLVGKEGCSKGVCTVTIDNDSMECMFSNLGIQCVKKKDVEQALRLREEIRVDPFGTGFGHRNQPQNIDLNAVRLCFQVFLNDGKGGRFTFPLKPVVSEPIYDKKAATDLNICKLSDCTSCVSGGKEIILLCDKVAKEDIQVRFFEVKDGHIEWEGFGDFQAADVHKQVAISFKTPRYKDLQVEHSVKVFVQLQRPSDKSTSEPRPFEYLPMDAVCSDRFYMNKRRKINEGTDSTNVGCVDMFYADSRQVLGVSNPGVGGIVQIEGQSPNAPRSMKVAARPTRLSDVKVEPPDYSLSPPPESRGMRTVTVKPPISSQHTGGGLMFQNIPHVSLSPSSLQAHLPTSIYFTPQPPSTQAAMVDVPLHSPQAHFYQIPPGLPTDPSQSPYSSDNPPGSSAHPSNQAELLASPSMEPNLQLMEDTEIPSYSGFNQPKPSVDPGLLPDLGIINSSELNVDSVNNLSASLSCSLNLSDMPLPLNQLDKKSATDDDKRSLNTPNTDNFFANIPNSTADDAMKSEDNVPSASSDSMKFLKGELEALKNLSERR